MTLPNDSILVTPGTGATVATHIISSKEYQAVILADPLGHLLGSKNIYIFEIAEQVHVASANTIHWDLFNADASLVVRVLGIYQKPGFVTAVTGIPFAWQLIRTTSVGTSGSAQTAWLPDLSQAALDVDITCRSKPAGGAASGVTLKNYQIHSEETNASTQMLHVMMMSGVANLVDYSLSSDINGMMGIVLRQNQGIKCVQVTNSAAGNTGWTIVFTVE